MGLAPPPARAASTRAVTALQALARLAAIVALTTVHVVRFAGRWARWRLTRRGAAPASLVGHGLAELCEALGPTFIKAGQILSARPDLLPDAVARPLARLQDRIAPFDTALVPALLEHEFGRPTRALFAEFDPAPVSAASIAHVHRARLHDGREVAVKIRRPGIVARVEADLRLLSMAAGALARLPGMRTVPLRELVAEISAPIRMQLDFEQEAAGNRRLRAAFDGVEHVKLPALVEELCTPAVLTMEYLGGLRKVTATEFTPAERKVAALAGLRALYKMIFTDGFVHADMHPGNVFLREWGEFVMLDTGLTTRLAPDDQRDFVDFFFGLAMNRGQECARVVWDTALWISPRCERAAFEAAMVELIARHSALKSREFEITTFVYQLMALQRRFRIRGSTKFIMVVLSMVVFDGICKQLHPECDFQAEARGYLIAARYRRAPAARAI